MTLSYILILHKNLLEWSLALIMIFFSVRLFFILAPLSRLLETSQNIFSRLNHIDQLNFFYKKNIWERIELSLGMVDKEFHQQTIQLKTEANEKTILLEAINDEIVAVDKNVCIIFANKKFMSTFDQNKDRLQEKGKIWSLLPYQEINDRFDQTIKESIVSELKEISLPTIKGEKYFSIKFMPIIENEVIHGAVAVFRDVTEAKLTEQMRVDFIANVSHEMRTPLTSLMGYSQMLNEQKTSIPNELHPFLNRIESNSKRMLHLFNDLLQLSVIESKYKLEKEKVNLTELIQETLLSVQGIYHDKKIQVIMNLDHNEISVDPKLFDQVFMNLIDNACKYSGPKPVIHISSLLINDVIKMTISDNGPGILPDHLKRIFERFYRIDSSRDREQGGTGLGLAIVKHIIQKHNGKIYAESNGKDGTTFIIEIPQN